MKLAHRIITPLLALGTIAMGLFMKMFYFGLNFDEKVSELANLGLGIAQLFMGDKDIVDVIRPFLNYDYSIYELFETTVKNPESGVNTAEFLAIFEPIKAELITFIVFLVLAVLTLLVVAVVSAMGKRKATIISSCVGLVFLFVSIVASRLAFDGVKAGEISLGALANTVIENPTIKSITNLKDVQTLIDQCLIVQKAILGEGFFAVFGMFILIIFWTILTNMLIKTPLHLKRKHRRKLVIKRPSAFFQK